MTALDEGLAGKNALLRARIAELERERDRERAEAASLREIARAVGSSLNDPIPCADPAWRAVQMAVAMREPAQSLCRSWRRCGCAARRSPARSW